MGIFGGGGSFRSGVQPPTGSECLFGFGVAGDIWRGWIVPVGDAIPDRRGTGASPLSPASVLCSLSSVYFSLLGGDWGRIRGMVARMVDRLAGFFADDELNKLYLVIVAGGLVLWLFFKELTPLLGGVLVAYLLERPARTLEGFGFPRALAAGGVVLAATLAFIAALYALPGFLLELRELGGEASGSAEFLRDIAVSVNQHLPEGMKLHPDNLRDEGDAILSGVGEFLRANTLEFALDIFSLFVYLVLLPLLVFFLLKDKEALAAALARRMPTSHIFAELWESVDEQFGSYLRGKCIEAVILGTATWLGFLPFGLHHSFALAALVGLSVFVPYVGAMAVTIPVVIVAALQFGFSAEFAWVIAVYAVIQALDAQVLVPLLFAGVVRLHPVSIFAAILFFGNLWGAWGVFFAIPLASLIKSVLAAVDKRRDADAREAAEAKGAALQNDSV